MIYTQLFEQTGEKQVRAGLVGDSRPLPLHMALGHRLRVDVPATTILTAEMIEPPSESRLWALRRTQDQTFSTER